jgi:hypothetical protein
MALASRRELHHTPPGGSCITHLQARAASHTSRRELHHAPAACTMRPTTADPGRVTTWLGHIYPWLTVGLLTSNRSQNEHPGSPASRGRQPPPRPRLPTFRKPCGGNPLPHSMGSHTALTDPASSQTVYHALLPPTCVVQSAICATTMPASNLKAWVGALPVSQQLSYIMWKAISGSYV